MHEFFRFGQKHVPPSKFQQDRAKAVQPNGIKLGWAMEKLFGANNETWLAHFLWGDSWHQFDGNQMRSLWKVQLYHLPDVSLITDLYLSPPGSQSGKFDWCLWSSCSSPPPFWPPGKKHEMTFSPQRGVSRGSLSVSGAARRASSPHTPSGRWCESAFWSSCFGSIPAHRDCRSCGLFGARTSVSAMPAGERNEWLIYGVTLMLSSAFGQRGSFCVDFLLWL